MKNPKQLLDELVNFKKESYHRGTHRNITPKVQNEKFRPDIIRGSSLACEAMCKWVHAMHNFYHVNKQVDPCASRWPS